MESIPNTGNKKEDTARKCLFFSILKLGTQVDICMKTKVMDSATKIFIVDDDLFSLGVYSQGLENLGYKNISLYLNGTICLNNLHKKPTVIFLDHNMDKLTGFEVLKKIKRYDPDINVVIVSGQEDMKVAVESLKYGAFDYIIKGDDEIEKMQEVITRIESIQNEINKSNNSIIKKIFSFF